MDRRNMHVHLLPVGQHVCQVCEHRHACNCSKALQSHCRVKHNVRASMREYAKRDWKLSVRANTYHTRPRRLSRRSDNRRTKCRDEIDSGERKHSKLSVDEIKRLDVLDSCLRTAARRERHTHPICRVPALSAEGKRFGYITG